MPLIHANGVELHYHLQGKGTPIVFLHPPCIGSRVFTYLRNDLAEDHKTLLFDFRGHGRSGGSRSPITIPLLAEDLRQLLDRLNISQAYLCGYSLGTMVALDALLTYPDRFLGGILLGGVSEVTGWKTRAKLKAGLWAGKMKARDLISIPLAWAHADNRETFYRIRGETMAGDIVKWREYMASGLKQSFNARLGEIRQPMMLLCGQKDKEFKGYMKTLQKGLTNYSAAYIPGLKHTIPIYGAEPIGELVRGWVSAQELDRENELERSGLAKARRSYAIEEEERLGERKPFTFDEAEPEAQEPFYH
ncbi:alpha/beta fold hydrolase [Cohnella lupini]|uniref:Pimeloyl-ACP methyl ester carboxylesterase n=1 Tax=Cohnella lupini TaxID=1294267 RepID=A0A3D9I638_9BACL|nr:alpha/beta hydrolase [Cohnella lupini]RED57151.1 pimeloyl-ACP methyl ester carboxylesterase [Cohnella lupini]